MAPFVSILIPCYNAEPWLAQAIESALLQGWAEKEVIVVDDGSTDGSVRVIESFGGSIRWEISSHLGGNAARNRLLELASGDWLQYLDADDYLLPDKIERQLEFLLTHPGTDVVFGPVTLEYWSERNVQRKLLPVPPPHDPWILLARWYLPQTGSPLWRTQAILDVGGWNPDQSCCQEHELYLRLLMAGKRFMYCPSNGAIYRQWSNKTLSKENISEVHHRRLEIVQGTEHFLRTYGGLTADRLWAINQARFEIARMAWLYDRKLTTQVVAQIHSSQSSFVPRGDAARLPYRLLYMLLGFAAAERIAAVKRFLAKHLTTFHETL